jgi:primosomal protein N'
MIARVTLELALRKEFDYLIPLELEGQVEVGTRVQVPFGPRKVLGCVTGLAEASERTQLKSIREGRWRASVGHREDSQARQVDRRSTTVARPKLP